jgi:hypothetical protein
MDVAYLVIGLIGSLAVPLCYPGLVSAEPLAVGRFSELSPSDQLPLNWEPLVFPNIKRQTTYTLIREKASTVIRADSDASASGLIHAIRIDANRYPILQWKWKINHVLDKGDLTRKQGDDYAARIYVAFVFEPTKVTWWERFKHNSADFFAGKELPGSALNYIWANKAPKETIADNPYAPSAKMIAVQSGCERCGQWVTEERNIVEDYSHAFGRQPPQIIGIAIMTDTDNTQEKVTAYYGDIILKSNGHR